MNKICTDIKQSKRLIELGIDVKTADMYYSSIPVREWKDKNNTSQGIHLVFKEKVFAIENTNDEIGEGDILAWSLAALLSVLPNNEHITTTISKGGWQIDPIKYLPNTWWCEYEDSKNSIEFNISADNPIDACVSMILKLHEQNLL